MLSLFRFDLGLGQVKRHHRGLAQSGFRGRKLDTFSGVVIVCSWMKGIAGGLLAAVLPITAFAQIGIGVADPATATIYERDSLSSGPPSRSFSYGVPGWDFFAGDWNGDGTQTIGAYDPSSSTFYLRNTNSAGPPDYVLQFGAPNSKPVIGDWNADGIDTIGVFDSSGIFSLRNSNTAGLADVTFQFGNGSWTPIAGDWNGDGIDSIGVFDPNTANFY